MSVTVKRRSYSQSYNNQIEKILKNRLNQEYHQQQQYENYNNLETNSNINDEKQNVYNHIVQDKSLQNESILLKTKSILKENCNGQIKDDSKKNNIVKNGVQSNEKSVNVQNKREDSARKIQAGQSNSNVLPIDCISSQIQNESDYQFPPNDKNTNQFEQLQDKIQEIQIMEKQEMQKMIQDNKIRTTSQTQIEQIHSCKQQKAVLTQKNRNTYYLNTQNKINIEEIKKKSQNTQNQQFQSQLPQIRGAIKTQSDTLSGNQNKIQPSQNIINGVNLQQQQYYQQQQQQYQQQYDNQNQNQNQNQDTPPPKIKLGNSKKINQSKLFSQQQQIQNRAQLGLRSYSDHKQARIRNGNINYKNNKIVGQFQTDQNSNQKIQTQFDVYNNVVNTTNNVSALVQKIKINQQNNNNKAVSLQMITDSDFGHNKQNLLYKGEQVVQKRKNSQTKRHRLNTCEERQIQQYNISNNQIQNSKELGINNNNIKKNNMLISKKKPQLQKLQSQQLPYQQQNISQREQEINSDGKVVDYSYRNNFYSYTQQDENNPSEEDSLKLIKEEKINGQERLTNSQLKQYLTKKLIKNDVKIDWAGAYKYIEVLDSLYNKFYVGNLSDLCRMYHELLDKQVLFNIEKIFQQSGNQKIVRMAQTLNNYIVIFIIIVQLDKQLSSAFSQKLQNCIQQGLVNFLLILDMTINSSQNGQITDKSETENIKIKKIFNKWIIKFFNDSAQKSANQVNSSQNQGIFNKLDDEKYNTLICHQFCTQFNAFQQENNQNNRQNSKFLDLKPACTKECQKMFLININKITDNIKYIKNVFTQISQKFNEAIIDNLSFAKFFSKHMIEAQNSSVTDNFYKMRAILSQFLNCQLLYNERNVPSNIEYLVIHPSPYLPVQDQLDKNKKFSLVLDLDETLIHTGDPSNDSMFLTRPYAKEFLAKMSEKFEIIIFTAGMTDYANAVLDKLDTEKNIDFRLYRQHTMRKPRCFVKDLSRLGRDVDKCILIDNLEPNFQNQKQNGIFIKSWYGDKSDQVLKNLIPYLMKIHDQKLEDVYSIVKEIKELDVAESRFNEPLPPYLRS